jgi:hypothetical protein
VQYRGKVIRQSFAAGSKSEHEAVALLTPNGPLKLRRPGGNPFADPELDKLVGREIVVDGELMQGQLLMHRWETLAND